MCFSMLTCKVAVQLSHHIIRVDPFIYRGLGFNCKIKFDWFKMVKIMCVLLVFILASLYEQH